MMVKLITDAMTVVSYNFGDVLRWITDIWNVEKPVSLESRN